EATSTPTEQDALEGELVPDDIRAMLRAIPATRASARKARLFACAMGEYCGGVDVLHAAERHADGAASLEELQAARAIARAGSFRWTRFMCVALYESPTPWPDLLRTLGEALGYPGYTHPCEITICTFDDPRFSPLRRCLVSLQMALDLFGPHLGRGTL